MTRLTKRDVRDIALKSGTVHAEFCIDQEDGLSRDERDELLGVLFDIMDEMDAEDPPAEAEERARLANLKAAP